MKLRKLPKVVLSIRNNPSPFLNGITSNTLDKPRNAFLDIRGRIVATFEQTKISDDQFLIVLEEKFFNAVMSHLDKFIRLSKASVEKEDFSVYFDLTGEYKKSQDEFVIPQKKGQLVITRRDYPAQVSHEEFTLFRLKNQLPVQGIDYQDEFLLNVDEEEFVSYTKGCFLGQELVAKVHNRSKPSLKLAVKNEEDCTEEEKNRMTSKMVDPESAKAVGFIFVKNQ